jgi:hypothetical protein
MKIRQLILSTAAMMILGTGCVVEVSDRSAYESCSAGQACGGGTICQAAAISTNGGAANFCTVSCGAGGFVCPAFGSGSAYAPTCINSSTGIAQCYDTCASDFDCGVGTACRPVVGVPNQVCLPIGGAPINNPVPPAVYTGCAPAGATCASGTTCLPTSYIRSGGVQGNTCTIACPSGDARMCPGYTQDPTRTECVAPNGNVALAQCMRLCNPANGDADCTPYLTHCAAVPMVSGTLFACVP